MDEAVTRRERLVRWGKRLGAAMVAGLLLLWLAILAVPLPERLGARDSVLVLYQDGRPAHVFLSPDDRWRIGRPTTITSWSRPRGSRTRGRSCRCSRRQR